MNIVDTSVKKTTTVNVNLSKGFQSILFLLSLRLYDLTNEMISIKIQRPNRGDVELTNGFVNLLQLLLVGNFSQKTVSFFDIFNTSVILDLSQFGAIKLQDGEQVLIALKGLKATETYILDTIDSPVESDKFPEYVTRPFNSELTEVECDLSNTQIACFSDDDNIDEIILTMDNAVQVRYTPRELKNELQSTFPISYIGSDSKIIPYPTNFYVLPTLGIDHITIRKSPGTNVVFFTKLNS